jgi:nitrogen fixation protein NifZ
MSPTFNYGDEVRVVRAIRNDGTMPGFARGEVLVRRGSTGFVREWGTFLMDQVIFQVHFLEHDLVVGCRLQELIPAHQPWHAGMLHFGDAVTNLSPLSIKNQVVVPTGERGRIEGTDHGEDGNSYIVAFAERWFQVPVSVLRLEEDIG